MSETPKIKIEDGWSNIEGKSLKQFSISILSNPKSSLFICLSLTKKFKHHKINEAHHICLSILIPI